MTKKRVIKTISFSKKDEYEVELLDFALNYAEYFGRYVKRLIADHMARARSGEGELLVVPPVTQSNSRAQTVAVESAPVAVPVDDSAETVETGERVVRTVIESSATVEDNIADDTIEEDDFSDDMMNFV